MDGMFEVLSRPEGADRLAVVVVVVVGHVDAIVEDMEHPMSNFQYFLLSVISYFSSWQMCSPLLGSRD